MNKPSPERRRTQMKLGVTLAALGFLFVGAWQISPAAAFIVVGAVVWIDLTIGTFRT